MSGINAAVAASVPICAKGVSPVAYFMAIRCGTYREAYDKWLFPIKDRLPIALVEPWERVDKNQVKVLDTTSQYSQGNTAPANLGRRSTEMSRSVDGFSDGAHKPEPDGILGKISPEERASRRIPKERVCPGCYNDILSGMALVNGVIVQLVDHSKCGDAMMSRSNGELAPKAGAPSRKAMIEFKAKMQG